MNHDFSSVIQRTCERITIKDFVGAGEVISGEYPFLPMKNSGRSYTTRELTGVFIRDGFIDRYRGTRLVYPPVLRVLSRYLPAIFPYHKNGKMDEGHMAYWELFPTIDHVIPVAKGGADNESNWVCCSMLTNSIKSSWTLDQLQWKLLPPGDIEKWDGMFPWLLRQVECDRQLLDVPYIKSWFYAAKEIEQPNKGHTQIAPDDRQGRRKKKGHTQFDRSLTRGDPQPASGNDTAVNGECVVVREPPTAATPRQPGAGAPGTSVISGKVAKRRRTV